MEEFPHATITQIELFDFMTYDHVIQKPGPKINFILGRNGSGKSSIVCAIALCCGSSPSFIGRASKLDDFIKHGRPSASVELTLSNPSGERPVVIRRVLRRGKSNECYYNGRVVTMEVYSEKIKEMNIMADNLVQFLPQERVIDFSLMSAVQLLENTEKTVGHLDLYKIHQELMAQGNKWENDGAVVERLRREFELAKDKEAQLKHDVEALGVREDISTIVRLASLKMGRLEIVDRQAGLVAAKGTMLKLNANIQTIAEIVVPFEKKMVAGKAIAISASRALVDAKKELENYRMRFESPFFEAEPDNLQRENAGDIGTLKGSKTRHDERMTKIKTYQQAIVNLETQRVDTDIPALKAELLELQQEQINHKKDIETANSRKISILANRRSVEERMHNLMSELNKLETAEDGVSQYLRANDQTSFRARQWLKQNADKLIGKVYGPVYAEVKLKFQDTGHADILGNAIPSDAKNMFICEEDADMDCILKEMVQGRDAIKVPIKKMNRQTSGRLSTADADSCRRHIGCQSVVSDLFEAPDPVYRFLVNKCRMAMLPIFDNTLDRVGFEEIKKNIFNGDRLIISTVYAGGSVFKFRKTRFSANVANTSQPVPFSAQLRALMTVSSEKPDVQPLHVKLDEFKGKVEEISQAEQQIVELTTTAQEKFASVSGKLQAKRTALSDAEKITNRIKATKDEMGKLQAVHYVFEEEAAKTAAKIRARSLASWKKILTKGAAEKTRIVSKTLDINVEYLRSRNEASTQSRDLKANLRKMMAFWDQYRHAASSYERDLARLKGELGDHVKQLHSIPGSEKGQLSTDMLKQYSQLPSNIAQLEAVYKSKKNLLNAAGEVNVNARRDLEKQISATEKLEHSIATHKDTIAKEKDRFAKERKKWMDSIQELVNKIGANFSHFYKTMNLAGDVVLQKPDNPDHFDAYGFAIKVSYRSNRPLETLSGQVHSGGEKSVATALYMLAIQELTKCPFRVVDEINQGMDAENERRVFKMIVETAGRCGGQYFILSPKLLPDLHLTSDVCVTVILAGPEMHSGGDLDMWQLSKIARRLRQGVSSRSQPTLVQAAITQPPKDLTGSSRPRNGSRQPRLDQSNEEPEISAKQSRPRANVPSKRVMLEESDEDTVDPPAPAKMSRDVKYRPPHSAKRARVEESEEEADDEPTKLKNVRDVKYRPPRAKKLATLNQGQV